MEICLFRLWSKRKFFDRVRRPGALTRNRLGLSTSILSLNARMLGSFLISTVTFLLSIVWAEQGAGLGFDFRSVELPSELLNEYDDRREEVEPLLRLTNGRFGSQVEAL